MSYMKIEFGQPVVESLQDIAVALGRIADGMQPTIVSPPTIENLSGKTSDEVIRGIYDQFVAPGGRLAKCELREYRKHTVSLSELTRQLYLTASSDCKVLFQEIESEWGLLSEISCEEAFVVGFQTAKELLYSAMQPPGDKAKE